MRKVSGARPWQLGSQFLLESLLLGFPALVLGLGLAAGADVVLPRWLGSDRDYSIVVDTAFWGRVGLVYLGAVLLSGVYPAFVLTRFQPITVLKGRYSFSKGGTLLRQVWSLFSLRYLFCLSPVRWRYTGRWSL